MTNTTAKFAYQLGALEASLKFLACDLATDGIIKHSDIEELTNRIQKLMDKCEQKAEAYVNGN
jgi:hypothetical protein